MRDAIADFVRAPDVVGIFPYILGGFEPFAHRLAAVAALAQCLIEQFVSVQDSELVGTFVIALQRTVDLEPGSLILGLVERFAGLAARKYQHRDAKHDDERRHDKDDG